MSEANIFDPQALGDKNQEKISKREGRVNDF